MKCSKECIILAGVGGMMPTLSRLASTYVTDPSTPLPEIGLFIGLSLFFVIGSVLAVAFSETNLRQAFILGVCAPGLITNIVAGVNDAASNDQASLQFKLPSISSAYSQDQRISSAEVNASVPGSNQKDRQSTIEKTVVIHNTFIGASEWDIKNIPVYVTVIGQDGSKQDLAKLPADQKSIELNLPENSSAIAVRAASISGEIQLIEKNYTRAVIESTIRVDGKHDFLWALGAEREPRVIAVDSTIRSVELAQPQVSVKALLGEPVKTSDGKLIGKLEDIKLGPTGEIETILIQDETGRIKTFQDHKIEHVNNELIIELRQK